MTVGDFGSKETLDKLREFYYKQTRIVERLIEHLEKNLSINPNERIDTVYFLLFGLFTSSKSIILLSQSGEIAECFMLARSVVERIITVLYLLICEEGEFERFVAYSTQKAARMRERKIEVDKWSARLKASNYEEMISNPEISKALGMFTSNKGKTITRWSKKSIKQMLDAIAENGLDTRYLMIAILGIYDDASEALHGTLYGAIFHTGVFEVGIPQGKSELGKRWDSQFTMLFLALGSCVKSLLKGLNNIYPIQELFNESDETLKGLIIKE